MQGTSEDPESPRIYIFIEVPHADNHMFCQH